MALFEVTANDKRVYEEELKDFLPDRILDLYLPLPHGKSLVGYVHTLSI